MAGLSTQTVERLFRDLEEAMMQNDPSAAKTAFQRQWPRDGLKAAAQDRCEEEQADDASFAG